jgi:hypothetical protein
MTHASSYPALATAAHAAAARGQTTRRKSIFAWVLEALHGSRRLQAGRILYQHRHLIARLNEAGPYGLLPKLGGNNSADQ